jgi:uncharacterized protein YbjT (DUF2867 family)
MKATLIGASGLVGGYLLDQLLNDPLFVQVQILVRKKLPVSHPNLTQVVVDFNRDGDFQSAILEQSVVFSCIGTTQKKVHGDLHAYRKIDFDITVHAAEAAKHKLCSHFIFISAVDAASKSANFYLKLKGEIEVAIEKLQLPRTIVMRPSLLLGKRQENRMAEQMGQWIMPIFSWLLPHRYRPIQANQLATKMIEVSKSTALGWHIVEGKELFIANHG